MNNRRIGSIMMLMGLLLVAAALCLSVYNLAEERNAGRESERIMSEMRGLIGAPREKSDEAEEEIVIVSGIELPPENTPVPQGVLPSYIEEEDDPMEAPEATAVPTGEPEDTAAPAHEPEAARDSKTPAAERTPQAAQTAARPTAQPTAAPAKKKPTVTLAPAGNAEPTAEPIGEPERATPAPAEETQEDVPGEPEREISTEPTASPTPIPDYILHPEIEMPEIEIDGDAYIGSLELPALELTLPVMTEWSYPLLKKAPCRYFGSAYMGDMVVIAHNYETHFGRIKELRVNDPVIFTDVEGHVFHYEAIETEILQPQDVLPLVETDYPLTLVTCAIGGRTRVVVRCDWAGKERWKENPNFIIRRMTR